MEIFIICAYPLGHFTNFHGSRSMGNIKHTMHLNLIENVLVMYLYIYIYIQLYSKNNCLKSEKNHNFMWTIFNGNINGIRDLFLLKTKPRKL